MLELQEERPHSQGGAASDSTFGTQPPASIFANAGGHGLSRAMRLAYLEALKFRRLVDEQVISAAELELAVFSARRKKVPLEEVLLTEFQIETPVLGDALAGHFGVAYEPFRADRARPIHLLKGLKRDYVEQNHWLPIEENEQELVVMCLDPERIKGTHVVNQVFPRRKLAYRVTTLDDFRQTVEQMFDALRLVDDTSVEDLLSGMDQEEEGVDNSDELTAATDNELVKLVNKIIGDAHRQGASDIHIEPGIGKEKVQIRFRKDGSLRKYIEIPASFRNSIVARIKVMCDLDISERRKPQDGKIKFSKFGPLDIELRVATIPSTGGVEDVVMRILAAGEPIPLENLGLLTDNLERLRQCVSKPYGLFFVCGPTGSGKTTTLHSVLKFLNTPDTKIWTAEDPVEITQKGLRQVQVNKKAGLDFANVMRAFLRADPDVIMVGEMRDAETTAVGIEASLTGHLVLATLHTNSAPESIVRLLDMGMDPFNFSDALLGILAQRLAKRLCRCKVAYTPGEAEVRQFVAEYCSELVNTDAFRRDPEGAVEATRQRLLAAYGEDGEFRFHRPSGCEACDGTGYKGRVGLHELMVGTDACKRLIQEHARVAQLLVQALDDGMRTLKMDGMEKVLQGLTDMKQVRAVCIK